MATLRDKARTALGRSTEDPSGQTDWLVLDLHGSYPTHASGGALMAALQRDETFEAFTERLERIAELRWLRGVLVRVGSCRGGWPPPEPSVRHWGAWPPTSGWSVTSPRCRCAPCWSPRS